MDPGKRATLSPDLEKVRLGGSAGPASVSGDPRSSNPLSPGGTGLFGATGMGLPGSLQVELPTLAQEMRRRVGKAEEAAKHHGYGQGILPVDAFNGVTPQPKPKPKKKKKKGWFSKYVTDPIKHGVEDVGGYMGSVFTWRNMLDAGSTALGLFMMSLAGGMEAGGVLLDATGVGAPAGLAVNVAGAFVFTAGGAMALAGAGDFITRMSEGDVQNAWARGGKQGSSKGDIKGKPVSQEEQDAFERSQQDLEKLSRNKQIAQVKKGVEKDGQKLKPEGALTSGAKHGIDWEGGPERASDSGNPQGRFGSAADVHFATEKGMELKPGTSGYFELPSGNDCIEYMPDGTIRKPNAVWVKRLKTGVIHAYPTTIG